MKVIAGGPAADLVTGNYFKVAAVVRIVDVVVLCLLAKHSFFRVLLFSVIVAVLVKRLVAYRPCVVSNLYDRVSEGQ